MLRPTNSLLKRIDLNMTHGYESDLPGAASALVSPVAPSLSFLEEFVFKFDFHALVLGHFMFQSDNAPPWVSPVGLGSLAFYVPEDMVTKLLAPDYSASVTPLVIDSAYYVPLSNDSGPVGNRWYRRPVVTVLHVNNSSPKDTVACARAEVLGPSSGDIRPYRITSGAPFSDLPAGADQIVVRYGNNYYYAIANKLSCAYQDDAEDSDVIVSKILFLYLVAPLRSSGVSGSFLYTSALAPNRAKFSNNDLFGTVNGDGPGVYESLNANDNGDTIRLRGPEAGISLNV